jgi:hypothetical protein
MAALLVELVSERAMETVGVRRDGRGLGIDVPDELGANGTPEGNR